jgi:C_GCAxxG_C_C family probable redox protein
MERKDKAVELFTQGFNCSQAVFTAYRQADLLDEQTALKLATVFGAGLACTGSGSCGAVTGALLAISMRHGRGDVQSIDAKTTTYELAQAFMAEFASRIGSCWCEDILGLNIGVPENLEKARDAKLFETRCLDAVRAACDILEQVL